MVALDAAQISGELLLDFGVEVTHEVLEQDVFRRNRGIGLEFVQPMTVFGLIRDQPASRLFNYKVQT